MVNKAQQEDEEDKKKKYKTWCHFHMLIVKYNYFLFLEEKGRDLG